MEGCIRSLRLFEPSWTPSRPADWRKPPLSAALVWLERTRLLPVLEHRAHLALQSCPICLRRACQRSTSASAAQPERAPRSTFADSFRGGCARVVFVPHAEYVKRTPFGDSGVRPDGRRSNAYWSICRFQYRVPSRPSHGFFSVYSFTSRYLTIALYSSKSTAWTPRDSRGSLSSGPRRCARRRREKTSPALPRIIDGDFGCGGGCGLQSVAGCTVPGVAVFTLLKEGT